MGIDLHGLNFLRYATKGGVFGRTVTIGRQEVFLNEPTARRVLGKAYSPEQYGEGLLIRHMGASSVDSVDASSYEQATILHDMNSPLPQQYHRQFDTAIDGGCCEHVFNVTQALWNCSMLCKPGGQIIHILPANNFCGHGFWQFSPELFFALYSTSNGYADTEVFLADLMDTRHWFKVEKPANGRRVNVHSSTEAYVLVRTTLRNADFTFSEVQQSDYVHVWNEGTPGTAARRSMISKIARFIPAYSTLAAAYRRWRYFISRTKLNRLHPDLTRVAIADICPGGRSQLGRSGLRETGKS